MTGSTFDHPFGGDFEDIEVVGWHGKVRALPTSLRGVLRVSTPMCGVGFAAEESLDGHLRITVTLPGSPSRNTSLRNHAPSLDLHLHGVRKER